MLNQPMMEKLLAMRLHGMVEALKAQEQDRAVNELSFLERFALLVDQQWSWRENQALARRLKAAKLKGSACVEDIDYRAARGLDKAVMRGLAKDSTWVRNHENIFVIGPCGVGKSFLASALAQKACRDGYSALYLRAAAVSRELDLVRADHTLVSDVTPSLATIEVGNVNNFKSWTEAVNAILENMPQLLFNSRPAWHRLLARASPISDNYSLARSSGGL